MNFEPKYPIGTKFKLKKKLHEVIDIHKTYNAVGELVKLRYVTKHDFLGQPVINREIVETTIKRALWEEGQKREE